MGEKGMNADDVRPIRGGRPRWPLALIWIAVALVAVIAGIVVGAGAVEYNSLARELASTKADFRLFKAEQGNRLEADEGRLDALDGARLDVSGVYDKAIDSIVTVHCGESLGSGFAWNVQPAPGYSTVIVTNEHVIDECVFADSPGVTITMHDGSELDAKLWNWDASRDLALIMATNHLTPLQPADEAHIGDPTLAIGSPQGLAGSVTTGIVSNVYSDAYQTDAAINHGNSGGPLLDRRGHVLGITTLGLDREGLNIAFRPTQLCAALIQC